LSGCAQPTTAPAPTTAKTPTAAPTAAPTTAPAAEAIELKAVTFLPKQSFSVKSLFPLMERVNAQTAGKVKITYLGGPEVMPPPQQAESVRNNVVQMALVPFEYYEALTKMGNMGQLSLLTPDGEQKSGAYDYMNELHHKVGLHLLWRATAMSEPQYFWFITNKKISKPQEFAGQKIGASSTWPNPFLTKVGATPVQVQITDFYTNLERKVIDGAADPITNHMTFQLYEVCKYVIDRGVGQGALAIIVNLDTWNKIPAATQNQITDIAAQVVREYALDMDKEVLKAKQTALDKGMEFIKFSPEDEKWFVNTHYEESWAVNISKYPEVAPKMRQLMSK
jgi:TRAP-type C4-dicarboxylate transport system substrate-binding protein